MDWKSLVADLIAAGMTQKQIGEALGRTQPTISALARGDTLKLDYEVGQKLKDLHRKRVQKKETAASAERRRAGPSAEATESEPSIWPLNVERRVGDRRTKDRNY